MTTSSKLETGMQRAGRYKAAHAALPAPAARAERAAGASPAWAQVAKGCLEALGELPEGANLGFVYVTAALAGDLGSVVTFLRERSGIDKWFGTVGEGVVASGEEFYDRPALSVLVAALPAESFRAFAPIGAGPRAGGFESFAAQHAAWVTQHRPILGVVHGDPRNPAIIDIIEGLAGTTSAFWLAA